MIHLPSKWSSLLPFFIEKNKFTDFVGRARIMWVPFCALRHIVTIKKTAGLCTLHMAICNVMYNTVHSLCLEEYPTLRVPYKVWAIYGNHLEMRTHFIYFYFAFNKKSRVQVWLYSIDVVFFEKSRNATVIIIIPTSVCTAHCTLHSTKAISYKTL